MNSHFFKLLLLAVFFLSGEGVVYAQKGGSTLAQMGFSELATRAVDALENHNPGAAIPLLKEIMSRAGSSADAGVQSSAQNARLLLGEAYLLQSDWNQARSYAQTYLDSEPVHDAESARMILSRVALGEEDWQELYTQSSLLLKMKLQVKNRVAAEKLQLQALYNLERFAEALELIPSVLASDSSFDHIRMCRIMQVRCLMEIGEIDRLVLLLPKIFRGELRYDISFNLMLLHVGDRVFGVEEYRKALAVYRLVVPKSVLMDRLLERKKQIEDAGERVPDQLTADIKALDEEFDYDKYVPGRVALIYSEIKRYWEAIILYDQIFQNYSDLREGHEAFVQKVLLLYQIEVYDEAIAESLAYLKEYKVGVYPRIICSRLAQHYLQQEQFREVLTLPPFAEGWKTSTDSDVLIQEASLFYLFGFAHFRLAEYDAAFDMFDRAIRIKPGSPPAIAASYWKGMCRLFQQKYEPAYDLFMEYREKWGSESFAPDALFRAGVCKFGMEDYEAAKVLLKAFIDEYPSNDQMPSALSMYGDLLASDGLIDEALTHYERAIGIVEKQYAAATDSDMRQQLEVPAAYAVMQAAKAMKADAEAFISQEEPEQAANKYRMTIEWMERYMNSFGTDADYAQAIFWVGKAKMELGNPEEAVQAYLNAVITYGTDPAQEGVTSILFNLSGMIKNRLPQDRIESTVLTIKQALSEAKSPTLHVRLEVLLAELDGTQSQLGQALLAREQDLTVVPPSGLGLMCTAAQENQDFSRARDFFDLFAERYIESPFRVPSFKLLATDLYQQKNLDEAYEVAKGAVETYGGAPDVGWAQLMKGNIELARSEYEAAAETFNAVFGERAWRGSICAEAMFRMAEAHEALADAHKTRAEADAALKEYEKAFAFYQRTYLIYKAYDDGRWAADAYLRNAQCLKKMGRHEDARKTYAAMLLDVYVRDLPQAKVAIDVLGPEVSAKLLAGGEDVTETIELEGSR
jgi:tetratricopeptide (TPR) repeat protein